MSEFLQKIADHREAILLGEIGALLHMFGKYSSEFLQANSLEGGAEDSHQNLKHLTELEPCLRDKGLQGKLRFTLSGREEGLNEDFTDFITKYSKRQADSALLKLFNTCHRMTSADEKGVVRRKQSKVDMWITTPFGYRVQKIDLDEIDSARAKMDCDLAKLFASFLQGTLDIDGLHDQVVTILQKGMSKTLGETRQPANDVTLWAQSHGVASLYKPVLAALAIGLDPCPRKPDDELDYSNLRWRLFGVGWNGLGFVQRGRRPGDILKRRDIVNVILKEVEQLLEVAYPIGNLFYADLNGAFITFPGIDDDKALELVRQITRQLAQTVRQESDNELWPFFTLSRPRRTLTTITREIDVRDRLASIPRIATFLRMEKDTGPPEEHFLEHSPYLEAPRSGEDICPVCQFRNKREFRIVNNVGRGDEVCSVCRDRRSNRQKDWHDKRHGQTIWVNEVADENGRIALLTLRFDLSRWLSGEWQTTTWSQTLEEWARGERLVSAEGQVVKGLKELTSQGRIQLSSDNLYASALSLAEWVLNNPTRTERKAVLEAFLEKGGGEYELAQITGLLGDVQGLYGACDAQSLLKFYFTQHPSPPRLMRIWEETEAFLDIWLKCLEADVFAACPQRLCFKPVSQVPGVQPRRTYRITVPGLRPGTMTVVTLTEQEFLTIDSLDKFEFTSGEERLQGLAAVQAALTQAPIESWQDDDTGQPLPDIRQSVAVEPSSFGAEPYLPFITVARSPVFCQVLMPATNRASLGLRKLLSLIDERFGKVRGKLPLHVGLLVAGRKFPLYALIEAGQQVLSDPVVQAGSLQHPWWDTTAHAADAFYGSYPTEEPASQGGHVLTGLVPVNAAQSFWLTPGYFDFDFLGPTADGHRLVYEDDERGHPIRPAVAYGHLRPRPLPLHRLSDLFDVWDSLVSSAGLGKTQRHQLAEGLATKLEEWKVLEQQEVSPVLHQFSKTLLRRSFDNRWTALSSDQRCLLEHAAGDGLLLEALELFQHVLKEG